MKNPTEIQREYYGETATGYDSLHMNNEDSEHTVALHFLSAIIDQYNVSKILDVGAGTGRIFKYLSMKHPGTRIIGIEPVKELREQAYKKGISDQLLIEGDGCHIDFPDQSFDLVCEFGVLHHIPKPELMVAEMLRVAKKVIFISDNNNFGQGSNLGRFIKQTMNLLGIWKIYNFLSTKGRGYKISEGDGLFYSYSVFNNYKQIKKACKKIHLLNTKNTSLNFYKSASHIALVGEKNEFTAIS